MKKAFKLDDIDAAVDRFEPVTPDHLFYVNFENLRGDFQEQDVVRTLNVSTKAGKYVFDHQSNRLNKTLLFLAGMQGSGKTSELAKYAEKLDTPECFFVVTCSLTELDLGNMQYMDILVFQVEKLLQKAFDFELTIDDSILDSLNVWFQERVREINRSLKADGNAELKMSNEDKSPLSVIGLMGKLLGITAEIKAGLSGSYERALVIRTTFQNRFGDFSIKFNTFIEQVNDQLRLEGKGQEVLFIVDDLERVYTAELRRKIIMDESNRIRQIKANTIFTLPIELMKEEQLIKQFGEVVTFPFIKIMERDGSNVPAAIDRFEEFVCKRVARELFDSIETIHLAIQYSGGSPRQLLRIIEQAARQADREQGKIMLADMQRAIDREANSMGRYLQPTDFETLRTLRTQLENGDPIGFDNSIQDLLQKQIILEYNDGTYKRVNPLLELSKLYQYNVTNAA
jgi:hypothetical protein